MKTITNIAATFCLVCHAWAQSADPVRESGARLGGEWDEARGYARQVEIWKLDVDINGDGVDDLLVTRFVAGNGRGGNIWEIYLAGEQGYRRLEETISFRADLFLWDFYEGRPAVYSYWPESSRAGCITIAYVSGDQVRTSAIRWPEDARSEAWMERLMAENSRNGEKIEKVTLERPLPELVMLEGLPQSNFVKRVADLWASGKKLEVYDIACRRLSLNTNDMVGLILKMNYELSSEAGTLSARTMGRILDVGATIQTSRFREVFPAACTELQQYRMLILDKSDVVPTYSIGNDNFKLVDLLEALESDGYFEQGLSTQNSH